MIFYSKSYEHANASAIRGTESKKYADKMVDFMTVPRSINKTDAVALVSAFGSVGAAVNARPEEVAIVGGWGEKKVRRWCSVVDEPFRARKAQKRGLRREITLDGQMDVMDRVVPLSKVPAIAAEGDKSIEQFQMWEPDEEDEEALVAAVVEEEARNKQEKGELIRRDDEVSGGVAAALAKLRSV